MVEQSLDIDEVRGGFDHHDVEKGDVSVLHASVSEAYKAHGVRQESGDVAIRQALHQTYIAKTPFRAVKLWPAL